MLSVLKYDTYSFYLWLGKHYFVWRAASQIKPIGAGIAILYCCLIRHKPDWANLGSAVIHRITPTSTTAIAANNTMRQPAIGRFRPQRIADLGDEVGWHDEARRLVCLSGFPHQNWHDFSQRLLGDVVEINPHQ